MKTLSCLPFLLLSLCSSWFCVCSMRVSAEEEPATFEERLVTDWLYQDVGMDISTVFRDSEGNKREEQLVGKVLAVLPDSEKATLTATEEDLVREHVPGSDARWKSLYQEACRIRRIDRLATVVATCPEIVYARHHVLGASFYSYTDDTTDEQYHDYSRDRRPGSSLCRMSVHSDGSVTHETLVDCPQGVIRDPDVSWDGKRILFSMRNDFDHDDFHLYVYNVDTKETRQITFGPGFADTEPVYLPNGDILFASTRCVQVIDCWWTEAGNFYVCDPEGRFMRRISFDQVSVNYPKVLDDGRVIYTRWDYNDRGQVFPQPLFVMNADGTGQTEYYGNNSYFPTTILHARGIPHSGKVLAIASGHHTHQHGKLIRIDRSRGTQEATGVTYVSPVAEAEPVRIDRFGQEGEQFQYPYPLSETEWLVSYRPESADPANPYRVPFAVYAMDEDGQRELLAWDPTVSCGQSLPLVERETPPLRPSPVDETSSTGQFYVHNVYEGPGLAGIPKGTIESLRVVSFEVRAAGIMANSNSGQAGGAMVSTPIADSNGSWDVKHVLGTVPVESDGSAFFEVPARQPLYFQLLDRQGDVVQTMRSWSTLQPGELFACVGCHEQKESTALNVNAATSLALSKPPQKLTPTLTPGNGMLQKAGFSFVRDVQPILDSHCVECHTGEQGPNGSEAPFSLLGNEKVFKPLPAGPDGTVAKPPRWSTSGRRFSESYLNLTQDGQYDNNRVKWLDVQSGPPMLAPYTSGAFKSPLIQMFRRDRDENHRNVTISDGELRTLALWIDLLVPFCGDYLEENNWSREQLAEYAYYDMKKKTMARIVNDNINQMLAVEAGREPLPSPNTLQQFTSGGLAYKGQFIGDLLATRLPDRGHKTGTDNVYRNLALNPEDTQGDPTAWPHASTNSEYARLACFAAKNVLDGQTANRGHGDSFPSWGPNKRADLWLQITFGHTVETDKIVLWLRADFPHDDAWTSAQLEFSDGTEETIQLQKTDAPQSFSFPSRKTDFVRLTHLTAPRPLGWCGITELEVWGTSAE